MDSIRQSKQEKAERSARAAEAALKLIEKHGLERLTIAQVARLAKISRPWIYKYIGPSQNELIEFAVDHFGRILSAMDERLNPKNPQEWIAATRFGTVNLLDMAAERPWLVTLYFRYRGTQTVPGKRIDQVEGQYLRIFATEIQTALGFGAKYSHFLASSILAVRMGLAHQWVTSSSSTPATKAKLLELVEAILIRMVA